VEQKKEHRQKVKEPEHKPAFGVHLKEAAQIAKQWWNQGQLDAQLATQNMQSGNVMGLAYTSVAPSNASSTYNAAGLVSTLNH
jgi:hypothetical protein